MYFKNFSAYVKIAAELNCPAAALHFAFRCRFPRKDFQLWHAPRSFGTFCPEVRLLAVLPQPGYSFSDGHSVFKVLSIDELI